MAKSNAARCRELQDNGSTRAGCREPLVAPYSARKVESSSESESPRGIGARQTYNSENAPIAAVEVTGPTTLQADVTAN